LKSAEKKDATIANVPWENPLIPNKRLRELYTSMVELRLLNDHALLLQSLPKAKSHFQLFPGEEACRVSTMLSLLPGDLTSDATAGVATNFLRGTKLDTVLRDLKTSDGSKPSPLELPLALDTERRLLLAIGAALALAVKKRGPIVLAYIYPGELTLPEWKPLFRLAASHSAPIIFVALSGPSSTAKPGKLAELSSASGAPGIPVDAADAVALYRVVQESMVRVRAGGGPVVMECIPFQLPGQKSLAADPILNMRAFLIQRKIADDAWFNSIESRFASRLKATVL
jgi:TPP-dependent pyruvate/acetoin dehydrogenase alpha subunit